MQLHALPLLSVILLLLYLPDMVYALESFSEPHFSSIAATQFCYRRRCYGLKPKMGKELWIQYKYKEGKTKIQIQIF